MTPTRYAIHPLFRDRRSQVAFVPEPLSDGQIGSLLEAACWAPSSFNEQPWRFVVANHGTQAFQAVLAGLTGRNQRWARRCGALFVVASSTHLARNGKPNDKHGFDTGAAAMLLQLQAQAMGLASHVMGGFDRDVVRAAVELPDVLDPEDVPRFHRERTRRAEGSIGRYGQPLAQPEAVEDVLGFWFGELDADGLAQPALIKRWFIKDPAFDDEIRTRFGALHESLRRHEHEDWLASARGRLATLIVLDQFSRNLHRGSPLAFANDARCQQLVHEGIALGLDRSLATHERVFFYMPLMHSEALDDQQRCIEVFQQLADEAPEATRPGLKHNIEFAIRHRDIIARWGRFPHRNQALGRPSTPEEQAFLETPGSSF